MTRMPLSILPVGVASVSYWWNEINESSRWQDGIFFFLCAAYALVSSVALICVWICLWINENRQIQLGMYLLQLYHSLQQSVSFYMVEGWICYSYVLHLFLIRCIVVGISAFDADTSLEVMDQPVLNLIYYILAEILTSALVLHILRKLPPKRVICPVPSNPLGRACSFDKIYLFEPIEP